MMKNAIIYSEGNIVERVMILFETIQKASNWPFLCLDTEILKLENINAKS